MPLLLGPKEPLIAAPACIAPDASSSPHTLPGCPKDDVVVLPVHLVAPVAAVKALVLRSTVDTQNGALGLVFCGLCSKLEHRHLFISSIRSESTLSQYA